MAISWSTVFSLYDSEAGFGVRNQIGSNQSNAPVAHSFKSRTLISLCGLLGGRQESGKKYVQQNIKYITKNIYIRNLGYVEVLSENAINKVG